MCGGAAYPWMWGAVCGGAAYPWMWGVVCGGAAYTWMWGEAFVVLAFKLAILVFIFANGHVLPLHKSLI